MSVALLDVNVLIALRDRRSCTLQNAVRRILGQPRHPNSPGPPAVVAPLVAELIRHPRHQFWPDSLGLVDHNGVNASRLLVASQLTDTYLLALAEARGGRLASFDRRLSCAGVAGGREALWLIES